MTQKSLHPHTLLRTVLVAVAWIAVATSAAAERPTVAGMIYDLTIERPIGLAETLVGVAVTGLAYPIALGTGTTDLVVERCIAMPGRYTFTRGLGVFSKPPESNCSPVGFGWGLVRMSFSLIERPLGLLFGRSPFSSGTPKPRDELEVNTELPRTPARQPTAET